MTTSPTEPRQPSPDDPAAHDVANRTLAEVWDPELGIDIVSLGLIYDVRIDGDRIDVDMTLTTPGCPVSEQLPAEAHAALQRALPDSTITVNVVWDPPWSPANISPLALARLSRGRQPGRS